MRWLATALLLGGCQGRTELMVGVVTELKAPDLIDRVEISVENNGVPVNLGTAGWAIGDGLQGTFVLPGSYGLNSSDGSPSPVTIVLTATKGGRPVVVRSARTSLVSGKTLFMRMGLVVGCMGNTSCPDGQSCIEGACKDNTVDAHTLPEFAPELVDHVTCASGELFISTKDNSALPTLGDMQCSGACVEGTCYRPPPDGGAGNLLWTPLPTPPTVAKATLNAIWGSASASNYDLFAVGDRGDGSGVALHLNGQSGAPNMDQWVEEPLPTGTGPLASVSGSSANDVWAVGANSTVVHRVGGAWTTYTNASIKPGIELRSVFLDTPAEGFMVGSCATCPNRGGGLQWDGVQWGGNNLFPTPTPALNAVGMQSGFGLAVGDQGAMYGWMPGATSWSSFGAAEPSQVMGVNLYAAGGDGQAGYAVGQHGTIVRIRGMGAMTQPVLDVLPLQIPDDLFAVFGVAPGNVYAVGKGGSIWHATDGMTFVEEQSSQSQDLHGLWAGSASDVFAVGAGGTVLHSTGIGGPTTDMGVRMQDGSAGGADMGAKCGMPNGPCCPGNACANGGCCVFNSCVANGGICNGDLSATCSNGACGNCGGSGLLCCPSAGCTAGFTNCVGGSCMPCGNAGQSCCPGNVCQGSIACVSNVCGG